MSPWLQHLEDNHQQSASLGLVVEGAVEGVVEGVQQQLQLEDEDNNNNAECEFLEKDQTSPMTQMHQPRGCNVTLFFWN